MKNEAKILRLTFIIIAFIALGFFFIESKKRAKGTPESGASTPVAPVDKRQATVGPTNSRGIRNSGNCPKRILGDTTLDEDFYCHDFTGENVIEISADSVTLDCAGHSISLLEGGKTNGIGATGHSGITVKNCLISGGSIGIRMENTKNLLLENNKVKDVGLAAIDLHEVEDFSIKGNEAANQGKRLSAIELFGSYKGKIEENRLSGFRLSGITINGSENIEISNNKISLMGDTGIGLFRHKDRISSHIQINNNDISTCTNVGGVEIMHGSHDIGIAGNFFHKNRNAVQIYSEQGEPINNLEIRKNKFDRNNSGVSVMRNASNIIIRDNEFSQNNTAIALSKSERIRILENRFTASPENQENNPSVLDLIEVKKLQFNRNIIVGFTNFIRIQSSEKVDFSLNYWGGCPPLETLFSESVLQTLMWINPVHTTPCKHSSRPVKLTDENNDGLDDNHCRTPKKISCFDSK